MSLDDGPVGVGTQDVIRGVRGATDNPIETPFEGKEPSAGVLEVGPDILKR